MAKSDREQLMNEFSRGRKTSDDRMPSKAKDKFQHKLDNCMFDDFNATDWKRYVQLKVTGAGLRCMGGNPHATSAILKSCVANFTPEDIKAMIDFLFDSGQTTFDVTGNVFLALSKSWLDFTYNNSQLWLQGKFMDKSKRKQNNKPTRVRESRLKRKAKVEKVDLGGGVSI